MDLKPFISNVTSWRKHFQETSKKGYDGNKRFHTIQEGSRFPLNNVISISPTKQSEEIAKSEIIEINKSAVKRGRVCKKRKNPKQSKKKSRTSKTNSKRKSSLKTSKTKTLTLKKRTLSHKKKR